MKRWDHHLVFVFIHADDGRDVGGAEFSRELDDA